MESAERTEEVRVVRVGTRKSQLARIQTDLVVEKLKAENPDVTYEIVAMTTTGDQILDVALSKIGEKSLFTKELERALEQKEVDLVVHSLKDLPTALPAGFCIGTILKREDPRDAVVLAEQHDGKPLAMLPVGSVIGTSSPRRVAQLRRLYPHLVFKDVRGNLNTRLRKLDAEGGPYAALVLAAAGLIRMGWAHRISQLLSPDICMYAVGQGALAVETRVGDDIILSQLSMLTDQSTALRCIAERAFLRKLEGGCSVPVAVHSELENDQLSLMGVILSLDGTQAMDDKMVVDVTKGIGNEVKANFASRVGISLTTPSLAELASADWLGTSLAQRLLGKGAAAVLEQARIENAST
uniref:porphobilinogen deaminase-like n=1 Tax=Myxine glutinosa TaxID=7769 RepID=UPI0035902906